MKVGFTGTQDDLSVAQFDLLTDVISELSEMKEAHHGCCVGADQTFNTMVKFIWNDVITHGHFPDDNKKVAHLSVDVEHDPEPYLVRNHNIVDACDILIACPKTLKEQLRSGTWATIRYARKVGKPIAILWKDGKYTYDENKSARQSGKTEKDEEETSQI